MRAEPDADVAAAALLGVDVRDRGLDLDRRIVDQRQSARRRADQRIVSILEGGYDLTALARCAAAHVQTLMGA